MEVGRKQVGGFGTGKTKMVVRNVFPYTAPRGFKEKLAGAASPARKAKSGFKSFSYVGHGNTIFCWGLFAWKAERAVRPREGCFQEVFGKWGLIRNAPATRFLKELDSQIFHAPPESGNQGRAGRTRTKKRCSKNPPGAPPAFWP